ncbi:hypothetical protein DL96DRAFT_394306 [Flagelloscypha sp. PMI_526]|nr:hypothetical protein DL96DRAFT_394306 [Flagelloscypha sp. PMI_526]
MKKMRATLNCLMIQISTSDCLPLLNSSPYLFDRLTLDGTRNSDESLCPLVDFITGGRFPSLVYLDFHNRMPPYFPIRDFGTIMPPLMGQLCCLDLGHLEAGTWDSPHLDHLHLRNYPKLLFLGIRMKANGSRKLLHRLDWFSHMFESLTEPHPLRIFDIRFTTYLIPKNISHDSDTANCKIICSKDGISLTKHSRIPNLSSLSKVGISMGLDREIIPVFEQNLSRLHEAGKLSFQAVNMDEFYWSLPKVTGR